MVCMLARLFRNKLNKKAANNIDTADPAYVMRKTWHGFWVLLLFYLDFCEYGHQALHAHSVQFNVTQKSPHAMRLSSLTSHLMPIFPQLWSVPYTTDFLTYLFDRILLCVHLKLRINKVNIFIWYLIHLRNSH